MANVEKIEAGWYAWEGRIGSQRPSSLDNRSGKRIPDDLAEWRWVEAHADANVKAYIRLRMEGGTVSPILQSWRELNSGEPGPIYQETAERCDAEIVNDITLEVETLFGKSRAPKIRYFEDFSDRVHPS